MRREMHVRVGAEHPWSCLLAAGANEPQSHAVTVTRRLWSGATAADVERNALVAEPVEQVVRRLNRLDEEPR